MTLALSLPSHIGLLGRYLERRTRGIDLGLCIALGHGRELRLGERPVVTVQVRTPRGAWALMRPQLSTLADAYIRRDLDVVGPLDAALEKAERLCEILRGPPQQKSRRWRPAHSKRRDRRSVSFHYDVGNAFYELWLDRRLVYSCAYFSSLHDDLDRAQEEKLDHICRKLVLRPGQRLLDVGCGWGALLLHAAAHYGVDATGITLSTEQLREAERRIERAGLSHRCRVELLHYKDLEREPVYDAVASIGMVEHVGLENLSAYVAGVQRCLKPGGLFLNHGIASSHPDHALAPYGGGAFIGNAIFPDTDLPSLRTTVDELARGGFEVLDVESLRRHYAKTLSLWRARLEARFDEAGALIGAERLRAWRLYLAGAEHAFKRRWVDVYQTVAANQGVDDEMPWTREHQYAAPLRSASAQRLDAAPRR